MKIDIQPREDHQVILTVEVEPQMLENAKARAARHISKHTKIPGFRPGKAPLAVVQRTVGAEAILEEAVELLINDEVRTTIPPTDEDLRILHETIDPHGFVFKK